jgi:hypothetical protein
MVAAMLLITALVHVALIVREWRHRADPAQVTFGGHAPPRGDA